MPRQSDERSRPDGDNAAEAPRSPVRSSRSACSIYFTENSDTHLAGNFLQASGAFFDCSDGLRLACLQAIEMFRHATDSAEPDFAGFDTKEPLNNSARARFTGKGAAAALSSPDWSVPSTLANIRTVRWPDSTCLTSAELSKCCSISV